MIIDYLSENLSDNANKLSNRIVLFKGIHSSNVPGFLEITFIRLLSPVDTWNRKINSLSFRKDTPKLRPIFRQEILLSLFPSRLVSRPRRSSDQRRFKACKMPRHEWSLRLMTFGMESGEAWIIYFEERTRERERKKRERLPDRRHRILFDKIRLLVLSLSTLDENGTLHILIVDLALNESSFWLISVNRNRANANSSIFFSCVLFRWTLRYVT